MSSSSVAAPAVVDKHAELLKMVNKCNHYKCTSRRKATSKEEKRSFFLTFFCLASSSSHNTVVRTFCMHCYMALIEASPKTVDCRLGVLCGCGARYCGVKCLVAASQAHKLQCESIQSALQFFAMCRFRANEVTNQAALKRDGGALQIHFLRADMFLAASGIADLLLDAARFVREAEAFELAQKFAQRALSLSANGSLGEANALDFLGTVARDFSKYDAAVAHYEAALKIRQRLHGDDHAEVASVYVNLSVVFCLLRRLDEALAMCSSALEIYSKAPGDNQDSIARCHNSMGTILKQQGKKDEAMEHYSIGLEITLKREGETADAAIFLVNIGAALMDRNNLDEAMEKYVSALSIFEKAKMHTGIAMCHHNIGTMLMKQGKLDAALEHARKSLEIRQSKLSHEHAATATFSSARSSFAAKSLPKLWTSLTTRCAFARTCTAR
jgi:tetratricopeptide (TPR) repeat protein